MANYGVLYVFRFESANKTNIEIQILKKDYSGARMYRSLGRAPILKREKSGCVHGSSLELYAECQVDGEFASLYTSSADEYKVEVYKIDEFLGDTFQRRVWTGFVSPELYSEPDIAPPYDVQIIATDGLGELKNYVFEARGLHSVQDHLEYMLGHTGLSQEFNVVSFMAGDSGTVPIMDVTVSLDHMAGESCYDVLKAVLDSFHAEIACQDGYWMIWRETDIVNLTSQVEVAEFGSQTKTDWWPVGQLSTVIEPAKKRVTVISEDAYKDNVFKDVPFHAEGATYDSEEKAFLLSSRSAFVTKYLNFKTEVGYKLSLSLTVKNADSTGIYIVVTIDGRSHVGDGKFWLAESQISGKAAWANTEVYIYRDLDSVEPESQIIEFELPLYDDGRGKYYYASSIQVAVQNVGDGDVYLYEMNLTKAQQFKGYKSVVDINNSAREEADEATLVIADNARMPAGAKAFMHGIALNAAEAPISSWASGRLAAMGYLAFMSRDYALSSALPRMKVQGVLNVPDSALIAPVLFLRDNTYYFPETYNYDLLNDELSVSLVSIPTAQIEVVSEEVTEVVDPFQSRPGGSAGDGGSSGGSSGGGEGSGEDSLIFEFAFDTSTNKATAEMVAGLAEAISENKLILCAGRTYKFILEQDGMYGLVSDAYLDIMTNSLKTSVLAVMASSYDVQLMEQEVPTGTEITEATIRGWGFTKNAGTITGIKMNGATKGTSGVVDLGDVLTEHQKLKTINNQSIVGEGNITIQGGGATPRVEMTAASAAIEPNKFYVWPMMDSLDLTLGAEQSGVMNRYLFQFRNPKAGLTMLTLPDDITWGEDTELDENGMPVMEAAAFYRIEIIEGLASLKKWKLVYINFADAEVERVLMSKGIGDGIGITKRDAKAVTSIGTWFVNNELVESFEEFEFFDAIIAIELAPWSDGGFRGCTNLKKIKLPQSLQTIFDGAIPGQYSSTGAFKDCTSLESIAIPPKVERIPRSAFYNCINLKNVVFEGKVKEIIEYAFGACENLDIAIPASVEVIGRSAFFGAPMNNVVIDCPNMTELSGSMVFTNSKIKGVKSLGKITALTFQNDPPGYYGYYPTFYGCADMEFLNLPETLIHIGRNMFQGCSSLKGITIPSDVGELLAGTFAGCSSAEYVKMLAANPPTLVSNCFDAESDYPIYVPDVSLEAYKAAAGWSALAARIRPMSDYDVVEIDLPEEVCLGFNQFAIPTSAASDLPLTWQIIEGSDYADIDDNGVITFRADTARVVVYVENPSAPQYNDTIIINYTAIGAEQISCVKTDGSQSFDTGYATNPATELMIDVQFVANDMTFTTAANNNFFGADAENSYNYSGNTAGETNSYNSFLWWTYKTYESGASIRRADGLNLLGKRRKIGAKYIGGVYYGFVDDYALKIDAPVHSFTNTLYIGSKGSSAPYNRMDLSIYRVTIHENGVPVRYYIPAKLADGTIGMYDIMTGSFHASATGNNFIE